MFVCVSLSYFPLKMEIRIQFSLSWEKRDLTYTIDDHSMKAYKSFWYDPFKCIYFSLSHSFLFHFCSLFTFHLKCLVFKRLFFKSIPLNCVKITMIKWLCVQHKQNGKIPTEKKYAQKKTKIGMRECVSVRVCQWKNTLEPYWLDEDPFRFTDVFTNSKKYPINQIEKLKCIQAKSCLRPCYECECVWKY